MPENDLETFIDLLRDFRTAMLVTLRKGELRSRPMAIADTKRDGRIRFITRDDSGKLAELEEDGHVNVALQDDERFLSVSGVARLTKDAGVIDETWERNQGAWFAGGRDDPHVIVLEVVPTFAEFWDRSKVGIVRFTLERAKKMLSDRDRLDTDSVGEHGNVDFHGKPL